MSKAKTFSREGRSIYVGDWQADGKPFITIDRAEGVAPVVADYVARLVFDFLNKSPDAKAAAKGYDAIKNRRNF